MKDDWHIEHLDSAALVAWLVQTADALGLRVDPHGRRGDDVSRLIGEARRATAFGTVSVSVLRASAARLDGAE